MRSVAFCASKGYGTTDPALRGRLLGLISLEVKILHHLWEVASRKRKLKTQSLGHRLVVRSQILHPSGNGDTGKLARPTVLMKGTTSVLSGT